MFCIAALTSCKSEPEYEAVKQQVMTLHYKLMSDGEFLIQNKKQLDSLANGKLKEWRQDDPKFDTSKEKATISEITANLNQAEFQMNEWMQAFEPDAQGKSNLEAVIYFNREMVKLKKLDSVYGVVLKQSDDYLKKFNIVLHRSDDDHTH